jgi:hypothetical protein
VLHLGELVLGEGASLFGLAESTADAGVGFKRTAEEVGTTTQKLQELNYAAKQWDMKPEAVQVGLSRISRMAVQAAQGSTEAIRSLSMAGVTNFRDAHGNMLRSDELLTQVAAKFKTMANDSMKAGLAVQVFGRGGKELMPLLNRMGPEFDEMAKRGRELGYVMGEEAIEASEKFKESTNQVRAMLTGLRNTIGVALMPAIERMVDDVIKWYEANREVINSQIVEFAHQLSDVVRGAFQMVTLLADGTMWLAHTFGGLGNVLKIITAGFMAWTAMGIVSEIFEIVEVVMKLGKAFAFLASMEALSTGGLSAILGIAGGLGVGAFALHAMNSGPDTSQKPVWKPAAHSNIHVVSTHHWDIHLPPGTPSEHAQELGRKLDERSQAQMRALAYTGSSVQDH